MSDLKPVKSCLIQDNGETLCSSMKRAILEVIVSGVARSVQVTSGGGPGGSQPGGAHYPHPVLRAPLGFSDLAMAL